MNNILLTLPKYMFFGKQWSAIILVFACSVIIRAIPELVAYPYPVGYDVINSYIPFVANFDTHWGTISSQFPLYFVLLHFVNIVTGLSAVSTTVSIAIAMFGAFGVSIYFVARSFQLRINHSMFLAIFVIFQIAVLRTAWDLHKDIFALTTMMCIFSLVQGKKWQNSNMKWIAVMMVFITVTIAADRMVGILLCISLMGYAIIGRSKTIAMLSCFAVMLFSILVIISLNASGTGVNNIKTVPAKIPEYYNASNLMVLFLVTNGLLLVPGALGFLYSKNYLLKIPLLISLTGSFSWLVFPDNNLLLADRWIILSGIFLSILAGYGIIVFLFKKLKPYFAKMFAGCVFVVFAALGFVYTVMPYDSPFVLYGIAQPSIEDFSPATMQFNSLDINDNGKLLSVIGWINRNTEPDAIIVGEKHWRGFMELYIRDQRVYQISDEPNNLAEELRNQGYHVYLLKADNNSSTKFVIEDISRK